MGVIIVVSVIIIIVSFLCSLLEAVLLSLTPAFVEIEKQQNPRAGRLMEHLKDNINRPLSAILTLNTISHTLGASAVGAMVYSRYGDTFVTLASILLTLGILILSEILPKVIGALYWKTLAPVASYLTQAVVFLMYPVVWLSEGLVKLFKESEEPEVTREEIIATAELGASEGELEHKESSVIKNLLMLDKLFVSDIMTPRSVVFALEANSSVEEVHEKHRPIRFSRIPVYEGSLDNMIGMTMRYKIHEALSNDQHHVRVRELVSPLSTVSERMSVAHLLDHFIKRKEHMSLVLDEYGIVTGLVSLEDAIETLLGVEIVDETDHVTDMRQYALDQWQLRKQNFRKS
ncbi:MAG: CNNM domain-containing protein [Bdellovibrio sp.]